MHLHLKVKALPKKEELLGEKKKKCSHYLDKATLDWGQGISREIGGPDSSCMRGAFELPWAPQGKQSRSTHGRAVCVLGWSRRTPLLLLPHLGTNGRTGTCLAVPAGPWPYAQREEDTPIQRIPRKVLVSFSENECLQLLTKGFYSLISVFCFCFLSYIARQ